MCPECWASGQASCTHHLAASLPKEAWRDYYPHLTDADTQGGLWPRTTICQDLCPPLLTKNRCRSITPPVSNGAPWAHSTHCTLQSRETSLASACTSASLRSLRNKENLQRFSANPPEPGLRDQGEGRSRHSLTTPTCQGNSAVIFICMYLAALDLSCDVWDLLVAARGT